MEIKTLAEVRAGNVTVTVTTTEPEGHDVEQAAEVLAENYARARQRITELEEQLDRATKGHVCTEWCTPDKHVAFVGRQRLTEAERQVAELETELSRRAGVIKKLENKVEAYDEYRQNEHDRADKTMEALTESRAWVRHLTEELNKRFTFQQVEDAKADARASEGARIRSEIRGLLDHRHVEEARLKPDPEADADFIGSPMGSWRILSNLIGEIRSRLDDPA